MIYIALFAYYVLNYDHSYLPNLKNSNNQPFLKGVKTKSNKKMELV